MDYINYVNLKKLFALGIIFLLITSTFLIFIPKIEAQKRFSGKGSGTPWDPYVITNVKQLQEMKYDLKAHYVLGNDIDASETKNWNNGQGFEPIGDIDILLQVHLMEEDIRFTICISIELGIWWDFLEL
jgi:hypothetical protein